MDNGEKKQKHGRLLSRALPMIAFIIGFIASFTKTKTYYAEYLASGYTIGKFINETRKGH